MGEIPHVGVPRRVSPAVQMMRHIGDGGEQRRHGRGVFRFFDPAAGRHQQGTALVAGQLGGQPGDLARHVRAEFTPPRAAADHEGDQRARQMGKNRLPFFLGRGQNVRRHAVGGSGNGQGVGGGRSGVMGRLGDQVEIPRPGAGMHDMNQLGPPAGQFLDLARGGSRPPPGTNHQIRPGRRQPGARGRRNRREGRPQKRVMQAHQGAVFDVLLLERQAENPRHAQALAAVAGPVIGQDPNAGRLVGLFRFGHRPLMARVPRPGNGSVSWPDRRCIEKLV